MHTGSEEGAREFGWRRKLSIQESIGLAASEAKYTKCSQQHK
jgi:hypothetical protein